MFRQTRQALMCAGCAIALSACASAPRPSTESAASRPSQASMLLTRSPALVAFLRAAEQQIVRHCRDTGDPASAAEVASARLEVETAVSDTGQLARPTLVTQAGDGQLAKRAMRAVAAVHYLPPPPSELTGQRATLNWRLSANAQACQVSSVRLSTRPMRAGEALELALARGHYRRAHEIILQAGARADVIRVLQRTLRERQARHVARASLDDSPALPVESLLAQAQDLEQR
jgi:hypothetical protein